MKVHIVSKHPTEDRILGRLARTLAASTGWSHSAECRADVDLNYVIPYLYLAERWSDWTTTPLAAYFSHLEPDNLGKRRLWERAAELVALRIVTAPMYADLLRQSGPTELARPPIDPQFQYGLPTHTTIRDSDDPPPPPIVGVSGWVYRDGRKGEYHLEQLLALPEAARYLWAATGEGWPKPINASLIPWSQMPAFYASLDVYLCTSVIEGVPMPPLEALACGVPVVIPRGVGLLDTLPDIPGIYRYLPGDIGGMASALHAATNPPEVVQSATLTDAVRGYTPDGWAFDHRTAFDAHITTRAAKRRSARLAAQAPAPPTPPAVPLPAPVAITPTVPTDVTPNTMEPTEEIILHGVRSITGRSRRDAGPSYLPGETTTEGLTLPSSDWRHDTNGIYIVAYGDPARACATRLLTSIETHMPGVAVAIASDQDLRPNHPGLDLTWLAEAEVDIGARSAKTRIYDLAPAHWEYVLYLDADTELVAPIPFLFDVLGQGWEFAICKNPQRFHIARHMARPDNKDECEETFGLWGTDEMMQWNGGVFSFRRCPHVEAFFRVWHHEWNRYGKRDQAAPLRALWHHPLRTVYLGNEWNTVTRYVDPERTAGILHYVEQARRWTGVVAERSDSPEAWERVRVAQQVRDRTNTAAHTQGASLR